MAAINKTYKGNRYPNSMFPLIIFFDDVIYELLSLTIEAESPFNKIIVTNNDRLNNEKPKKYNEKTFLFNIDTLLFYDNTAYIRVKQIRFINNLLSK